MKILASDKVVAQRKKTSTSGIGLAPPSYGFTFLDNSTVQRKENKTGMPDNLKSGVEALSGTDMSDVKVHYNSSKPAQLNALAYAQGNQIHLGAGQEKHLPHEAWHIAQQKQGRVQATRQMKDVAVNDDKGLEQEADVMGLKAAQGSKDATQQQKAPAESFTNIVQRKVGYEYELDGAVSERHTSTILGGKKKSDLEKGEVIADKGGFLVTADEIPGKEGGGSDVEIIIRELDDRTPQGLATLQTTVEKVIEFLTALNGKVNRGPVNAGEFGGKSDVFIEGAVDSGILQSSIGMSLKALVRFRSGEMGRYHENKANAMTNHADPLRAMAYDSQVNKHYYLRGYGANTLAYTVSLKMVQGYWPKLEPWYQQEIAGLVSVIVMPPVNARVNSPLPYAKASAGAMMARTNFSTAIQQLSGPAKIQIQDSARWVAMLLKTITILSAHHIDKPVVLSDKVFPKGSIKPDDGKEVNLNIELKNWLPHLVGIFPKDALTEKNYPPELGNAEGKHLESMGKFDSGMDPGFKDTDTPRPVFEFRKQLRVPLHHLFDVTVGIWELAHQGT